MDILPLLLIVCCVSRVHAGASAMQTKLSNDSTIELSCPLQQVIQVREKIVVYCSDMDDSIAASPCVHRLPPSELRPLCNGRQLCNEIVLVSQHILCPSGSLPVYFQVHYTCIFQYLVQTMCTNDGFLLEYISLVTPYFPLGTTSVTRPSCHCRVQGESITVTAVQIDVLSNSSSLTLSDVTDGSTLWSSVHAQPVLLYNTVLYAGRGLQTLDIVFNQSFVWNQITWIEVKVDQGIFNLQCGRSSNLITLPPASVTEAVPISPTPSTSSTVNRPAASNTASGETLSACKPRREASTASNGTIESAGPVSTSSQALVAVVVLPVLCVLLALALVFSNLYHLRGRLCRGRNPTYAATQAPVPEDAPPYTELRIYENRASEQEQSTRGTT